MEDAEREGLKTQLKTMAAGQGAGIDLDTPFHWIVEDVKDPAAFFKHLPALLPADSVLYVEVLEVVPEAAAFYRSHRSPNAVPVVRDIISPEPEIFHFAFSPEVSRRLGELAESHPVEEVFIHLKAYHQGALLFTFHDAFQGWLRISGHVEEAVVTAFCDALGRPKRREATKQRDPELIRRMLLAFDQSDDTAKQSWLGRLWNRLTRRRV